MKKFLVIGVLFLSQSLFAQIPYGSNSKVGKRVQVGDISMYYEMYGKGEPLILLHGGYGSSVNVANAQSYISEVTLPYILKQKPPCFGRWPT